MTITKLHLRLIQLLVSLFASKYLTSMRTHEGLLVIWNL